ncbi:SGNH/GDSL hydrolase family protein [Mucilaginibacter terrae]|uniref:Acyl-CoA thioesterase-1 n=1 Tax=Mucilaginibacter terrae TaxID=1955052 RepID=A0ABU3GT50_9SPHI|nr:SGNH/GDSL hydrolase family protein [Mucilaginibacter terrae]MDT3402939.1 acyl-CoA thioesterase-1 [Mucilaginibacter terrae]
MPSIKVACLGDSITQGTDSYNWLADLQQQFNPTFEFYNCGINGELAYNNLLRIQQVIDIEPDYVVILVGTNDVLATLSKGNTNLYLEIANLPRVPDMAWYIENLDQMITTLRQETNARIALSSLPVLGEDLEDNANVIVNRYNEKIQRLVKKYNLHYLPLNEEITEYLKVHPVENPAIYRPFGWWLKANIHFRTRVLKQDWDEYVGVHGLQVTTDTIHLNSVSGKMMADLVAAFIKAV